MMYKLVKSAAVASLVMAPSMVMAGRRDESNTGTDLSQMEEIIDHAVETHPVIADQIAESEVVVDIQEEVEERKQRAQFNIIKSVVTGEALSGSDTEREALLDEEQKEELSELQVELKACSESLDTEAVTAAFEEYQNNPEPLKGEDFNLEKKIDELDIDLQDQSGQMMALFQVWYNEDEAETAERREDRRTANIEENISEECVIAFDSMSEISEGVSLMAGDEEEEIVIGDDDIDDKCYQFYDGDVAVEMCLDEYQETEINGESFVTVAGSLKNIGQSGLCNVTFDIQDLDSGIDTFPETLPKVPDVFTPESEYKFGATIPIDEESHVLPYVDLWNSFYTCEAKEEVVEEVVEEEEEEEEEVVEEEEEVVVEEEEPVVVEEEEPVVEEPVVEEPVVEEPVVEEPVVEVVEEPVNSIDWEAWITPETACFYECYEQITTDFGGEENIEECPGLNYLFTHNCHSCDPFVVEASKKQCLEFGCTNEECVIDADLKTSGSATLTTSLALVVTGAMALFRRN